VDLNVNVTVQNSDVAIEDQRLDQNKPTLLSSFFRLEIQKSRHLDCQDSWMEANVLCAEASPTTLVFCSAQAWQSLVNPQNFSFFQIFLNLINPSQLKIWCVGKETQQRVRIEGAKLFNKCSQVFVEADAPHNETGLQNVLKQLSCQQNVFVFGAHMGKGTSPDIQKSLGAFKTSKVFQLYDMIDLKLDQIPFLQWIVAHIQREQFTHTDELIFNLKSASTARSFVKSWPFLKSSLGKLLLKNVLLNATTVSAAAVFHSEFGKTSPIRVTLT
jgi:hypothetical protein